MVDGTGTSSWLYDNADNVTKLTTPQGVMDYVYDQWNRKTSLKEGTIETQYAYSQGRLSSVNKSNDGVSTGLFYDSYGRLDQKIDGMTKTTYGYDTNDRLNSIVHARTSDNYALHQETYNYDYANNLMSKVVNSVLTSYTYDEIDQLKTENGGGIANFYNYDANGNRTSKNSNTDFETYAYDDADKLLSVTRVTHASTSYTYDACGRPTNIGSRVLNWDYEDRLTNINSGGVPTTNYGYNGVGSRVTKSNTNGSRSYKRNGVGVTAPVLSDGVATMVPGISEKSTGVGTNTILTDHLGSMKGMANAGNVIETAEFDAFGKVVAHGNPTSTQKGFASGFGYQEDGESGYKLLGHRYYDPETGRFLSRDPAFDGRNWYAYCDNNPLKSIDSDGLKKILVIKGDTSGPKHDFLEWFFWNILLPGIKKGAEEDGDTVEVLDNPTKEQALEGLAECDAAILYGHGNPGNFILNGNGKGKHAGQDKNGNKYKQDVLGVKDGYEVATRRARRGKGPMSGIAFLSCETVGDSKFVDAWLWAAQKVLGYKGMTHSYGGLDLGLAGKSTPRYKIGGGGRRTTFKDY